MVVCWPLASSSGCLKVGSDTVSHLTPLLLTEPRWYLPRPRSLPFLLLPSAETTVEVRCI